MIVFNNIFILDYIESICNLAGIAPSTIKVLASQARNKQGPLIPTAEEVVYIARQLGISYKKIEYEFNIPHSTQSRLYTDIDRLNRIYNSIEKKLSDEDYDNIIKFMKVVKTLKEI